MASRGPRRPPPSHPCKVSRADFAPYLARVADPLACFADVRLHVTVELALAASDHRAPPPPPPPASPPASARSPRSSSRSTSRSRRGPPSRPPARSAHGGGPVASPPRPPMFQLDLDERAAAGSGTAGEGAASHGVPRCILQSPNRPLAVPPRRLPPPLDLLPTYKGNSVHAFPEEEPKQNQVKVSRAASKGGHARRGVPAWSDVCCDDQARAQRRSGCAAGTEGVHSSTM